MADQPQAQDSPEQGTQGSPMPSDNQQTQEPQSTEPASPQGDSSPEPTAEPKLSEDAKPRTAEQFDKLKKQLAEEKERRLRYERVLSQTPVKPQSKSQDPDWYDPNTGEVNVNSLDSEIAKLRTQNEQLSQTVQRFASQQDERQSRAAYKAHPELDPNRDNFNEEFHNAVVGYLATAYSQGRSPSMKQAADSIKGFGSQGLKKAEKEGAQKALEQLTPKEQASLEASGRSDRRSDVSSSLEELSLGTRRGDANSIMARLKSIPPVGR